MPRTPSRERYARFARDEAPGRSALYEEWAAGVAADGTPPRSSRASRTRRQPPLVFAVTRLLGRRAVSSRNGRRGWPPTPTPWSRRRAPRLQTNEPLRCAALLPALSDDRGPIALLEIGASAGLCLYPDRYSYRFTGSGMPLDPVDGPSSGLLASELRGRRPPTPLRMPDIVWRAGIDLAPLDARDTRIGDSSRPSSGPARRAGRSASMRRSTSSPRTRRVGGAMRRPAGSRRAGRAARRDARRHHPRGPSAHPARRPRRLIARCRRARACGSRSTRPDSMRRGIPRSTRRWDGFVLARDARPLAAVDPLGAFVEWLPRGSRRGVSVSGCPSPTATAPSSTSRASGAGTRA